MIAPELLVYRPSTAMPASAPSSRPVTRGTSNVRAVSSHQEEFELLEYEWPDLPPISQIKNAISRSRVSHGISYLLPVDKGKNSVENNYRTDLRAMFQEPYLNDNLQYNDTRIRASAKHHFQTNTVPSRFKHEFNDLTKYKLNADSERVRYHYSRSAPSRGLMGRRVTANSNQLRTRSNLYLPMKAKLPPEALKLKEEVEKIIKSVREDDDEYDASRDRQIEQELEAKVSKTQPETSVQEKLDQLDEDAKDTQRHDHNKKTMLFKKTHKFKDYFALKSAKAPLKPVLPETLKSPYLSQEKNEEVWNWLNYGERITEFGYFLEICT